MFTGIVESVGTVERVTPVETGAQLTLAVPFAGELETGESVAVNGACLTATNITRTTVQFDLLHETLKVTNLGGLEAGDQVNLERALKIGDRLSGHFVQGHVDAKADILALEKSGPDHRLEIALPSEFRQLVVHKGSICINGISLTIAELHEDRITIWIIPHTFEVTNLHRLAPGSMVNLEFDLLAKHLERLQELRQE